MVERPPNRTRDDSSSTSASQLLLGRHQEVPAVALHLKGDQVVGEQSRDQLAPPRADAKSIRVGPRDVPEERGAGVGPQRPQRRRHERQVIVLDEHRRVGRSDLGVNRRGEPRVDVLIGRPILAAKLRTDVDHVAQRPQALVGKAAVVRGERRLLEPQPAKHVRRTLGRHQHLVGRIDHEPVGRAGAVRDPHAASLAHQRVQRHGDAAGRRFHRQSGHPLLAVEVRLAVRHDDERARRVRVELAGLRQPAAKQNRPDELVDRDRRHQQQLQLVAPPGKLGGDDRREPERNPGLRHQPGPRMLPIGSGSPDDVTPAATPSLMKPSRTADNATALSPIAATASSRSEAPTATKKTTSTGGAPRRTAARSVSPCATARFSMTTPAASAASSGCSCCVVPDLAEHGAHRQQHERDLTADVAQVEREQHADEHAEGDRAADLPRQARQHLGASAFARVEHDARQLHRHREQHQHHEVGEHDHRQHRVAQPSARARVGHHRGRHRRRERHDHDDQQGQHDQPLESDGVGRNGQPRPRHPRHRRQADDRDGQRRRGHADDRRQAGIRDVRRSASGRR